MPRITRRLNRGKKYKKIKKFRSSKRQLGGRIKKRTNKNRRSRRNLKSRQSGGSGSGRCESTDEKCIIKKKLLDLYEEAIKLNMLVEGGNMSPANAAYLADETIDQRDSRLADESPNQKKLREKIDILEGQLQTLTFSQGIWDPCQGLTQGSGTPPINYGVGAIGSRARAQRLGTGPIFGPGAPPSGERCTTQNCTTQLRGVGSGSNPGGKCAPLYHLYTGCNSGWCANVKH